MTLYRGIVIDAPWNEKGGGKIKRGADKHYKVMKTPQIIETILQCPVYTPDPSGCHIYLWTTNNFLIDGLQVMAAIGVRYVTNIAWVKHRFGLGYYFRGQHELCLFGLIGRLPPLSRSIPSVIHARRTKHSQKPDKFFTNVVERTTSPPHLEMFARNTRENWDSWGEEI